MLTVLLLGSGFVYWYGLIRDQKGVIIIGAAGLLIALLILIEIGGIALIALPMIFAIFIWAYLLRYFNHRYWLIIGWSVFVLVLLALGFRILPLFSPVELFPPFAETSYQFRPEKLILMLIAPPMVIIPWSAYREQRRDHPFLISILILIGILSVVLPIAFFIGFLSPGWVNEPIMHVIYWLSYNLIFTCVLEEAFFRGMVQPACICGFSRWLVLHKARVLGIGAGALIFGLAHIGGGFSFVVLATLAGIGYGLTYDLTGRLHYAVLVHFGVNTVRILGFSGIS